jgi:hypothetical protein
MLPTLNRHGNRGGEGLNAKIRNSGSPSFVENQAGGRPEELMTKTSSSNQSAGGGLHSKSDPQQGDLRDDRQGTYDPVGNQKLPDTNQQTEHERAQPGADVRGEPVPAKNFELPEGLKPTDGPVRSRQGT